MLYIYIIFFTIWFFSIKSKNFINLPRFIVLIYLLSAISCELIHLFYPENIRFYNRITFESVLYHIIVLFLFLFPIVHFSSRLDIEKLWINERQINIYSWFIVIPATLSVIVSAIDVALIFAFGNMLEARNAFLAGDISNLYISRFGILGYLISLGPNLSFIALILSFFYKFILKSKILLGNLLFICSFSIVLNNLAIAGREGITRWFIYLIFALFLFRKHIVFKENKVFFISLLSVSTIVGGIFLINTVDRFEAHSDDSILPILNYYGQPFYYFSYIYQRFADTDYVGLLSLFPILMSDTIDIYNLDFLFSADFGLNTFPTFVGTFLMYAGAIKTLLLALGYFVCIGCLLFINFKKLTFPKLVTYLFISEILIMGVFYYMFGHLFIQFTILVYIGLAYIVSKYIK